MACLAWSSRRLFFKLRRGGHKGVMWVREHARPTRLTGETAAHDGGQHRVYRNEEQACVCECKKCWTKEGVCSKREQGWVCLLLKQVETCKKGANVFAGVSAGADTRANTWQLV